MILSFDKCKHDNVKISGLIEECLNLEENVHKLTFLIDNQGESDFYVTTSSLFFEFELLDDQGERVQPAKKGETHPFTPR